MSYFTQRPVGWITSYRDQSCGLKPLKPTPNIHKHMKNKENISPPFGRADVKLIIKETVFQGYFRVDHYNIQHRQYQGGWGPEISREVFERGHAVVVLPYDPLRDEVVLIEQFRAGPYAAGYDPWMIEIVAGVIEEGEKAIDVACRELEEEAGLIPTGPLREIFTVFASPTGSSETFRLFYAPVSSAEAGGVHGLSEEGEDIRVLVLPFAKVYAALEAGQIHNAPAVLALQWLALNRDRLKVDLKPD